MTFYIFRCSTSASLFGATDEPSGAKLPPAACSGGTWAFVKEFERSAIDFSAEEAELDIKNQGSLEKPLVADFPMTTEILISPAPELQAVRGLIDTGASHTCVDPTILTALGVTPTGTVQVHTPTTGGSPASLNQYDVALVIPPSKPSHVSFIRATMAVTGNELLQAQGFHVLIGRDVLQECLFTYDGQSGLFTLAF